MESKIKFENIDAYLSSFPESTQQILKKLRKTIQNVAPEATETISYNLPTFEINGKYLVYFSAWKDHIAIYALSAKAEAMTKELSKYATLKGTLKFPLKEEIPYNLIADAVKKRAEQMLNK